MAQNILVIGELDDGAASTTTLELLAGASSLSEGGSVGVTLLGAGASSAATSCVGATVAYVNDDSEYDSFRGDQWLNAIAGAVESSSPDVVLIALSLIHI